MKCVADMSILDVANAHHYIAHLTTHSAQVREYACMVSRLGMVHHGPITTHSAQVREYGHGRCQGLVWYISIRASWTIMDPSLHIAHLPTQTAHVSRQVVECVPCNYQVNAHHYNSSTQICTCNRAWCQLRLQPKLSGLTLSIRLPVVGC